MIYSQLRRTMMDVTQWQDKWSHTHYLCAPAAEARRASLACEPQDNQWNVREGGGEGRGSVKHQPLNVHTRASFGTVSSDYKLHPQ